VPEHGILAGRSIPTLHVLGSFLIAETLTSLLPVGSDLTIEPTPTRASRNEAKQLTRCGRRALVKKDGRTASRLNSGHMLEEARFEFARIDAPRDEHDPRSMIRIRPSVEQHRGMKNVVDAVNDHWGALADQV
jgi:hypothetical protein